ncbi:MAG: DUF4876 domain-containing protein [Bacteroidales bacterium]|jgi:hypothetical protein|nr:DUF4876 domain-containing protein [Bacteroidales bacterium]
MKYRNFLYYFILFNVLFITVLLISCKKYSHIGGGNLPLKVQLQQNDSLLNINFAGLKVKLFDVKSGFSQIKSFDSLGNVVFDVYPGIYSLLVSGKVTINSEIMHVNAAISDFLLTQEGVQMRKGDAFQDFKIELPIVIPKTSALIIREVYYAGSKNINTGENYSRDQYIEIYNNSEYIQYLDSLFIGCMYPYNSNSGNHPFAGYDTTPIADAHWMFPGNGSDYPLLPGESAVIAECAIEHSVSDMHMHLENSHFAFYHPDLNTSMDASVTALTRTLKFQSNRYAISVSSPAIVIYRVPNVAEYYAHPEIWYRYYPGMTSGRQDWCIPQSWILDGVECFKYGENNTKRLRNYIDASYQQLTSGQNLGLALTRKIEAVMPDGRIIYQDTNNSWEDFEEKPANPRLR